jgi:hypothetical protein
MRWALTSERTATAVLGDSLEHEFSARQKTNGGVRIAFRCESSRGTLGKVAGGEAIALNCRSGGNSLKTVVAHLRISLRFLF